MRTRGRGRGSYEFPFEHPFKRVFREFGVRLWQLRNCTGVSESKLGRYLNGVDAMPLSVEKDLRCLVESLTKRQEEESKPRRDRTFEILASFDPAFKTWKDRHEKS
jgi:hypothetical protein